MSILNQAPKSAAPSQGGGVADSIDFESDYDTYGDDEYGGDDSDYDDEAEGGEGEEEIDFASLFAGDEDEETEEEEGDDDSSSGEDETAQYQQLIDNLNRSIEQLAVPEELIPEDFDATDPRQLRGLLSNVQKQTARNLLPLFMKPVELGLRRSTEMMQREITERVSNAMKEAKGDSVLEQLVPEISDPKHRKMLRQLYSATAGTGKSEAQRARALRNFIDTSGLLKKGSKGNRSQTSQRTASPSAGIKTGRKALDAIMPMPKRRR
jgi:hypothetical protein